MRSCKKTTLSPFSPFELAKKGKVLIGFMDINRLGSNMVQCKI